MRLESSLSMSGYIHFWYLFHVSKVTPECMPPTRGDFGHSPFFNLKGSLDIRSIHMGLFRLSTESLTTISITCFLCPSKEGTKSVHGNKICEKFIVINNVHTLPY